MLLKQPEWGLLKCQKTINLCNLHSTSLGKTHGWSSEMLHLSMALIAPGHPYLSLNYSAWLSSETETAMQVTAHTSFLNHLHCVNISCNATQIYLLRLPLSILKLFCLTAFRDRNCPASNCPYIIPEASPTVWTFPAMPHRSTYWDYPWLPHKLYHFHCHRLWTVFKHFIT